MIQEGTGILDVKFKAPRLKDDDVAFWNLLENAIDNVYWIRRKEVLKVQRIQEKQKLIQDNSPSKEQIVF